jgi:hypothetical protein
MDSTWQSFIPSSVTYKFSPKTNSLVGTYGMIMKGTLTANSEMQILSAFTITTFMVEVRFNTPPIFDSFSF